jgi:cytidine deaminase
LSHASYSAILILKKGKSIAIHAGANIDPPAISLFSSSQHRNCAEKQAFLSAKKHDHLNEKNLLFLFLYRKPESGRVLSAEKFSPCLDCRDHYFSGLSKNHGKLISFIDSDELKGFFSVESDCCNETICALNAGTHKIFYKIFDSETFPVLKVEQKLGSRIITQKPNIS